MTGSRRANNWATIRPSHTLSHLLCFYTPNKRKYLIFANFFLLFCSNCWYGCKRVKIPTDTLPSSARFNDSSHHNLIQSNISQSINVLAFLCSEVFLLHKWNFLSYEKQRRWILVLPSIVFVILPAYSIAKSFSLAKVTDRNPVLLKVKIFARLYWFNVQDFDILYKIHMCIGMNKLHAYTLSTYY